MSFFRVVFIYFVCFSHFFLAIIRYKGAKIEAEQDKTGHTPLHWAAIGGNTKMCFLLVLKGCNILKADALGQNGLMHAAQYGKLMTCYFFLHANQFFEEEDQLANTVQDTPIDLGDNEGHTALMWAAYRNYLSTVRYLLQEGADLTKKDTSGDTALHWAAFRGNAEIAHFLAGEGADANLVDKDGETPTAGAFL